MGPVPPRVLPYSSFLQNFPGEHVVQPILRRTKHQAKQMVAKKVREDKSGYHFSLHRQQCEGRDGSWHGLKDLDILAS
jgi:hypothetical protein